MFRKKEQKPSSRIETLIGAESSINGDIHFSGGLRVDGVIHGNVRETAEKACTLVLSERGRIEGAIEASHVVINGTVAGPVKASHYIELQSKSRVSGDVYYRTLEIHTGAIIEGKLVYINDSDVVNQELTSGQD